MSININSTNTNYENVNKNNKNIKPKQAYFSSSSLNGIQKDTLDIKKDATSDGKFTIGQALKNFGKGLLTPIKAVIEHPLITIGAIGLTAAAISAVPALGPLMLIGFGGYSLFELGKGIYKASSDYAKGEYDNAEKSFQTIGSGTIGTLLTLLGVKSSAQTVAELKYADKLKTQLTMYDKQILNELNKNKTFISALKENFTLLTTKEGRSALVNSFKPKNIKEKFIALKELETNNQKAIIERFKKTAEGQKRANLSSTQLKKDTINIINKAFDEAGIPIEARPKIIITDDFRCLTPKEANETLTKIIREKTYNNDLCATIFKNGESLKDLTVDELTTRLIKFTNKNSINLDQNSIKYIVDDLLSTTNDKMAGCYNALDHTLTVNLKLYRNGLMPSIENTAIHEALHARMSILRNSLSKEEISSIVKEILLNRIKNGEPEQIIKSGSWLGPEMMNAPKMDNKMRQSFINFAEKYLYSNNKELSSFLNERNALSSKLRSVIRENKHEEITKITQQLNNLNAKYSQLNNEITMLVKNNPEFIKTNGGTEEKALSVLFDYITSHEVRYNNFSTVKTNIKNITLSPEQKQQAIESLKGYIETIEGNSAINQNFGIFTTQNNFNQYQFSYEELLARNTAAKAELANFKNIMAKDTITAEKRAELAVKIKHLETELKYNEIGEKYYNLYQKLLKSPDDKNLASEFSKIQQEFNKISKNKILNSNQSYLLVDMKAKSTIPSILPTLIIKDTNKK